MLHLSPATGIFNENPVNNPGPSLAYDIKVPLWNKINYQRNDLKDPFIAMLRSNQEVNCKNDI